MWDWAKQLRNKKAQKDTAVRRGEILVQDPVDDVFYVFSKWMAHTCIYIVFIHHIMGHMCALQSVIWFILKVKHIQYRFLLKNMLFASH